MPTVLGLLLRLRCIDEHVERTGKRLARDEAQALRGGRRRHEVEMLGGDGGGDHIKFVPLVRSSGSLSSGSWRVGSRGDGEQ
jgi:hypothetical protein